MRNWNINKPPSQNSFLLRCEPTYEELKHYFCFCVLRHFPVASLPMRNWNLKLYGFLFFFPTCCEPTYEELKRFKSCIRFSTTIYVASLPMRNWNSLIALKVATFSISCEPTYEELKHIFNALGKIAEQKLRAYLWGIETCNSFNHSMNFFLVASLPMRNWNFSR